jgi:hypothetical protein
MIRDLAKVASLSVDMLPSSFVALSCCLPPHNGFMFLTEPLDFLLDSNQLLLFFYGFVFISFLIPVLHLDLVKLRIILNDLCW